MLTPFTIVLFLNIELQLMLIFLIIILIKTVKKEMQLYRLGLFGIEEY